MLSKFEMAVIGMMTHQYLVPPHYIMGYSFTEWLTLFSIIGMFIAALSWLIKTIIVSPLNAQISILSSKISDMNQDREKAAKITDELLKQHSEMLRDHEARLIRHDEDIKTLFKKGDSQL